jgi:hypothetical protein
MKITKTQLRKIIKEEVSRLLIEQENPIDLGGGVVLRTIDQGAINAIDKEGSEITDDQLKIFKPIISGALDAVNDALNRGFPEEVDLAAVVPVKIHNGLAYFEIEDSYNKYLVIGVAGPGHTRRR